MSTGKVLSQSDIKTVAPNLPWYRGDATDANLCITPGVWKTTPSTLNVPLSQYGVLTVYVAGDVVRQELTTYYNSSKYYRTENAIGITKQQMTRPWLRIQGEQVTS